MNTHIVTPCIQKNLYMPKDKKKPTPREPVIFHSYQAPGTKIPQRFFSNNQWNAPNCRCLDVLKTIELAVNGYGDELDLSWFYFDHVGASDWLSIAKNQDYLATQQGLSSTKIAKAIYDYWRLRKFPQKRIHLVGMGCGDGMIEIHIVNRILDYLPEAQIHLYLLDISPSLLNLAYANASESFEHKTNVSITAVYGDFRKLSSYPPFIRMAKECQEQELIVLSMFGYTFGNLSQERLFIRNSLRVFPKDTLLIMDAVLAKAPPNRADEILKHDPRLSGKIRWQFTKEYKDFWTGPFRRYRKDLKGEIKLMERLDYSTCIEGSYAIEIQALIEEKILFTLGRVKRYEAIGLANMFQQEGWEGTQAFRYGLETYPRLLYLVSKKKADLY